MFGRGGIFGEPAPNCAAGSDSAPGIALIPVGRLGQPRELGDLVAFLCSARAAYLTGTFIQVDGGLSRFLL